MPGAARQRLVAHDAVVDREPRSFEPARSRARRRRRRPRRRRRSRCRRRAGPRSTRAVAFDRVDLHAGAEIDAVIAVHRRRCTAPSSGPSPRTIGCGSASSTVTSSPRPRHVAATSAPMKPAPITTTFGRASSAARNASASSSVRSMNTPARSGWFGSRRGVEPVAITSPSNATRAPSAQLDLARARCRAPSRGMPSSQSRSRSSTPCLRSTMSVGVGRAGEQLLRERRPVVRQVRLGADRDDPAVVALAPERLDRAQPGERRADDRDRPHSGRCASRAQSTMEIACVGQIAHGLLDQRPRRLGRLLLEDVEEVVVAHLEDLGRDAHAHGVALALVEVDDDPHATPPPGSQLVSTRANATNWPET